MGNIKQINIKNRTYYFFNDMINIEDFDSNLVKIDKKWCKNVDIYYIGYIKIKIINDHENVYRVNSFYLIIGKVDGFIEEKNGEIEKNWRKKSKYLVFDSTDEKKEVLTNYTELADGVKNEIKTINSGKEGDYSKDFMRIKFNTDDDLPLNKLLKLHIWTIVVRSAFEKDGKFCPQIYLDECLYEL